MVSAFCIINIFLALQLFFLRKKEVLHNKRPASTSLSGKQFKEIGSFQSNLLTINKYECISNSLDGDLQRNGAIYRHRRFIYTFSVYNFEYKIWFRMSSLGLTCDYGCIVQGFFIHVIHHLFMAHKISTEAIDFVQYSLRALHQHRYVILIMRYFTRSAWLQYMQM